MKLSQFNFCHLVQGIVRLVNKTSPNRVIAFKMEIPNDEMITIPVEALDNGQWKAGLEWEHEGKNYFYEWEFEIPDN